MLKSIGFGALVDFFQVRDDLIGSTLVDVSEIRFEALEDASFQTISEGSLELRFSWLVS